MGSTTDEIVVSREITSKYKTVLKFERMPLKSSKARAWNALSITEHGTNHIDRDRNIELWNLSFTRIYDAHIAHHTQLSRRAKITDAPYEARKLVKLRDTKYATRGI